MDAIIDMAEEAAAWTVLYPSFSLVVPKPTKFFPVAYAVASENDRLLTALNAWLMRKSPAAQSMHSTVTGCWERLQKQKGHRVGR